MQTIPFTNHYRYAWKNSWIQILCQTDMSMQYNTYELDQPSQELCVNVSHFGKYKYKWLPVVPKYALGFVQQLIEEVLHNVDNTGVYLDDISEFLMVLEHHILLPDKILHQLEAIGFSIDLIKYIWAIQETNRLRYWITPTGLKSSHKNDGILQIQKLNNICQILSFSMLSITTKPCCSHVNISLLLSPASLDGKLFVALTKLTLLSLKQIKALMAQDWLLVYPLYQNPIHSHTDASRYQMGAYIFQDNKSVAFW